MRMEEFEKKFGVNNPDHKAGTCGENCYCRRCDRCEGYGNEPISRENAMAKLFPENPWIEKDLEPPDPCIKCLGTGRTRRNKGAQ